MIQWFNKKMSKKRKGFTLIELIVVIAILGILMALAIPRFSGFTDKAKISADEQYASIVANSLLIEFATGKVAAGTYTIAGDDGTVSLTTLDDEGEEVIGEAANLDELVEKTALKYYDSAQVLISANGDKTVNMIKGENIENTL